MKRWVFCSTFQINPTYLLVVGSDQGYRHIDIAYVVLLLLVKWLVYMIQKSMCICHENKNF